MDALALQDALAPELEGLSVYPDCPLAPLTTFRIGGPADLLVEVHDEEGLIRVLLAVRRLGLPHFLLGRGANILVGDRGFRGIVIRSRLAGIQLELPHRVVAAAGVDVFPDLVNFTMAHGLGGLHHFAGIPSTVGGALWQNLHFLSPPPERSRTVFIEEALSSARILTAEGEVRDVPTSYFEFGYDASILHRRSDVVLSATFDLTPEPVEELRHVVRENLRWRDDRHPDLWLYPSAGSIFQKIEGIGAGRLIDACGLKGHVIGGAGIFHRHANIIVNLGGARASEVRGLMELAQERVLAETGYALVPEIGLVGDF
jgi:UDP-N-acetylmuramate dehydrogenase